MKWGATVLCALRRFRFALSVILVLFCALWSAQSLLISLPDAIGRPFELKPLLDHPTATSELITAANASRTSRRLTDDDSVRISMGLAKKPTFLSTFGYWMGSWAGGDLGPSTPFGPYFRPLTSQLWWLQRNLAGANSLFVFLLVHLLWHLAFTLALWATLRVWWNDKGALLCIGLWCVGAPGFINYYAAPFEAVIMWKDDPEMTVGLCVLGAMMAMRLFVLSNRKHWVLLALFAFILSLSFKESGYVTSFFIAFALWRFGATKAQWRVVPLFFLVAIAAFAYRTWAIQGLGGHHGTNASWWMRAANELGGGTISAAAWSGNLMSLCVASLLLAVFAWRLTRLKIALFWVGVGVAAAIWSVSKQTESGEALIQLCDISLKNPIYNSLPYLLVTLTLWQLFILRRPRAMLCGYIWVLLAYVPLLKQAITPHGFYFFSIGWAWWLAGAFAHMYSQAKQHLGGKTVETALYETISRRYPPVRRPETSRPV